MLRRWNSIMDVMDLIEKEAVLSPLQVRWFLLLLTFWMTVMQQTTSCE